MTIEILHFADTAAAAQALAASVAADLRNVLDKPNQSELRALLLVSGGRSPLPFFEILAAQMLDWDRVDLSLVDERSVPHDHADSNAALVASHLAVGLAARARWLPLIRPEHESIADPWLRAEAATRDANEDPALSQPAAIVLGMGTDGHTASLFADAPQYPHACSTTARYVALHPGAAPHARVGLSLQALVKQRICYVWSGGDAKLVTLQKLQALAADFLSGSTNQDALLAAGPVAQLIARPDVSLRVFHADA